MSIRESSAPLTRWAVPGVALLAGCAYLAAGLLGDDLGFGVFGLVLMLAAGVAFLVATRFSETAAGLRERTDERINEIDRSAALAAGMSVLLAALAMFVIELAQGRDGSPYYQLGALGGVVYVGSLLWLRARR
ncbi:hypothetical protein [Nocardioides pacificus]